MPASLEPDPNGAVRFDPERPPLVEKLDEVGTELGAHGDALECQPKSPESIELGPRTDGGEHPHVAHVGIDLEADRLADEEARVLRHGNTDHPVIQAEVDDLAEGLAAFPDQ